MDRQDAAAPQNSAMPALKQRAALASIGASAALAIAKLAAGLGAGSLALISEGAHNTLDIGASILTYFAVREADKPADAEHPFGHAKIEAVAALAQTMFLAVLAAGVAFEALRRLGEGADRVEATSAAFVIIIISIGVDFIRWRGLSRVAAAAQSDALAGDALHFSSDLISSLLVLLGLGATRLGFAHSDALAAFGVAAFIGVAGYRLGRRTIDALVDAAPEGLADAIRGALRNVAGVADVGAIRLRRSGPQIFGEIGVSVSRTLPIERVAAIEADALALIAQRWPQTRATLTANPIALDDESVLERVHLIADRRNLHVHHVGVLQIGARKCVSLHLEVDGQMKLASAHEIATQLEGAIADELGNDVEVETHIEPRVQDELDSQDANPALTQKIAAALAQLAAKLGGVSQVHNVRVRQDAAGAVVVFHCRANASASVESAHDEVDALERALREAFPEVTRIIGHAEPAPHGGASRSP